MSAVKDLTILRAACLAFQPTLTAASESEDTDLFEVIDGDRWRLKFGMVKEVGQNFGLYLPNILLDILYSFKVPSDVWYAGLAR